MKLPRIPRWPLLIGPWLSYGLGAAFNSVVMAANGAQMPVLVPGGHVDLIDSSDLQHCAMTAATHLKILADWICLGDGIASPGDMLLWTGMYTSFPLLLVWIALIIEDHNAH